MKKISLKLICFKGRKALLLTPFLFLLACSSHSGTKNPDDVRLKNITQAQIEQSARITELENRVHELQGRLEELEYRKRYQQSLNTQTQLNQQKKQVKVPALPKPVVPDAVYSNTTSIVPNRLLVNDKKLASAINNESGKAFLRALNLIQAGEFKSSLSLLNEAIDLSYGSSTAIKVLFWKGIVYEANRENKKAIKVYSDIVEKNPNDLRARAALLRQASVFMRIGEKDLASITYKKLIKDYTGSREADIAEAKLQDIK